MSEQNPLHIFTPVEIAMCRRWLTDEYAIAEKLVAQPRMSGEAVTTAGSAFSRTGVILPKNYWKAKQDVAVKPLLGIQNEKKLAVSSASSTSAPSPYKRQKTKHSLKQETVRKKEKDTTQVKKVQLVPDVSLEVNAPVDPLSPTSTTTATLTSTPMPTATPTPTPTGTSTLTPTGTSTPTGTGTSTPRLTLSAPTPITHVVLKKTPIVLEKRTPSEAHSVISKSLSRSNSLCQGLVTAIVCMCFSFECFRFFRRDCVVFFSFSFLSQ
jgi:hypothetical protein